MIMVIDDQESIRKSLRLFLTSEGYQIETAIDGSDAFYSQQMRQNRFTTSSAPFAHLNALPANAKPLASWRDTQQALASPTWTM